MTFILNFAAAGVFYLIYLGSTYTILLKFHILHKDVSNYHVYLYWLLCHNDVCS